MVSYCVLWWTLRNLRSDDPDVRLKATRALAEFKEPEALRAALGALKDKAPAVRRAAAATLGKLGGEGVGPHLLAALGDADLGVRRAAAHALRSQAYPGAVPSLIPRLADPDSLVAQYCGEAILAVGWTAVRHLLEAFRSSTDVRIRVAALRLLDRTDDPLARQTVLDATRHEEPGIRAAAVEAARAKGLLPPEPRPPRRAAPSGETLADRVLQFALDDMARHLHQPGRDRVREFLHLINASDGFVRNRSIDVLVRSGSFEALDALLHHPLAEARIAAARAWHHDPRWIARLAAAVEDPVDAVRKKALRTLDLHSRETVPMLTEMLRGSDGAARTRAARILRRLNKQLLLAELPRYREWFESRSREGHHRKVLDWIDSTRREFVEFLRRVTRSRLDDLVDRLCTDSDEPPAEAKDPRTAWMLLERATGRSVSVAMETARRLALLGHAPAVAWLVRTLAALQPPARRRAVETLDELSWGPSSAAERVAYALASGREPPDDGTVGAGGGDYRRARWARAKRRGERYERCDFTAADLSDADLDGCEFSECLFARTILRRASLRGARFSDCILLRADLSDARLSHAECKGGVWSGSSLSSAAMRGSMFRLVKLDEVSFEGADLQGAQFEECDVAMASFRHSNSGEAAFVRTDLTRALH
ncbi:MAG: HEAT repeat domain-containing protein [Planctomycetes bacterium]|nr:HEAT repeat domain-containing protein [Planctomycetota bacterium]